ncbi:carboxypeptidase B-like [Vanessa atalanta]|uniref:carboxypeptidase B-like n=1 Tax=Vanessa atalanta TaxID=42275 RepID=UPI001FCE02A2|nr:carboxypeptidase B-like [Vanessa atalanta]
MADIFKIIFLIFASVYIVQAKHEEYDGHSLYEVKVNDLVQVDELNAIVEEMNLDLWSYAIPGREGLILVAKNMKPLFENAVNKIGVEYKIVTENIKEKLELEDKLLADAARSSNFSRSGGISLDVIHRYNVVDRYLTDLANRFPRVVRAVSAGRSVEGRDIKYLRISSNNFQDRNKPVVMIQSLLHAREWVTLPVTLYAIHKLVIDVTEQDLIRNIDWIILPIANPDGYEFSHTSTRMWRKNRRTGFGVCVGVDLNRNHDFNWGTASSNSACSDTFHGPRAFSEPETQITRNIITEFRSRLSLFIDAHSFGSLILYGYGNRQLPPHALILNTVGVQMAQRIDAVKWPSHRNYRVGNIAAVLYQASGGSSDYVQSMIGRGLSYTYELPAYRNLNNINGFLVDPAFVRQAGFETWEGIKVAARYVVQNRMYFKNQTDDFPMFGY